VLIFLWLAIMSSSQQAYQCAGARIAAVMVKCRVRLDVHAATPTVYRLGLVHTDRSLPADPLALCTQNVFLDLHRNK